MNGKGCCRNTNKKLSTYDWLCDLPETKEDTDYVEVQFKNTRKGFFLNSTHIPLEKGDLVAVEANPGHDIGEVTLTGRLVLLQMKKSRIDMSRFEVKRVYRKARETDIDKYKEAKAKEKETMIRARQISKDLHLDMKIGDVEYQGDGNKAIFYYIAEQRVDFRQLIKVLAEAFRVRIEMRQIGARQEAGRIGGIGPCGRELCCASWMSNFVSVSTNAARIQDISLNPQKLAGQCAKLKCCINYEAPIYADALKGFPSREVELETKDATWHHFKTDVFAGTISYSSSPDMAANIVTISKDRAKQIIAMNKKGQQPESLMEEKDKNEKVAAPEVDFHNVVGQDSLTRFDKDKQRQNKGRRDNNNRNRERGSNDRLKPRNNNNRSRPILLKKGDQTVNINPKEADSNENNQ